MILKKEVNQIKAYYSSESSLSSVRNEVNDDNSEEDDDSERDDSLEIRDMAKKILGIRMNDDSKKVMMTENEMNDAIPKKLMIWDE